MSPVRQQIEALHELYVAQTRHAIFLNPDRERTWFEWLRFRQPPFTADDLRLVIEKLKRGIKDGSRNAGALKFRNLIGQPDYFEEDLAEARAQSRPKPPAMKTVVSRDAQGTAERRVPSDGTEDTTRSAGEVLANIQKLKDAAK